MNQSQPIQAAIWMIGAIVSFTSMAIAGRELAGLHDTFEIMTFRSFVGICIVVPLAWKLGTLNQIKTDKLALHGLRNVAHFTGQNLWFFAVPLIPLAQVFALEFTTPIWVALMAPIFLSERLTLIRASCALLGFFGALLVVQPWYGFEFDPGLIAAALAAICFAGTAICTRLLTRTQTITCILFYLTLIQGILGVICAGYDGVVSWPTLQSLPWLVLVGCAGLLAHFCMTKALSLAPASVVMPIDFARLPIIALVAMILYNEPLEWAVLAGAVIIFAANYLNIGIETRKPA